MSLKTDSETLNNPIYYGNFAELCKKCQNSKTDNENSFICTKNIHRDSHSSCLRFLPK